MTECPFIAFLIACAIFAADFRPPSRPRRGDTSGVEQEVNKVFVLQLLSELKQVHRSDMATRSSDTGRMIDIKW